MEQQKTVRIACTGVTDFVDVEDMHELQGDLKTLSPEAYQKFAIEVTETGWAFPVKLWDDNGKKWIVGGHQSKRLVQGLRKDGWTVPPLPVVYTQCADIKEARRRVLQDIAQYGKVDRKALHEFTVAADITIEALERSFVIPEVNIESFKKEFHEDNTVPPGPPPPDAPTELPKETKVKRGDCFTLGGHRLMCGDSTNLTDVDRLLGGQKADMVFTDPPYNLLENGNRQHTNKGGDAKREDFPDWDKGFDPMSTVPIILTAIKPDASVFVCTSSYLFGAFTDGFVKAGAKTNYLVWCKRNPMPSLRKATYVHATELIVHARFGSPKFHYPREGNLPNYFDGNVEKHSTGHPAQKPLYVSEACIGPASDEGDVILDLFAGSGSTVLACQRLNRRCFAMEIDPLWCAVILDQWAKMTGQDPVLNQESGSVLKWSVIKAG